MVSDLIADLPKLTQISQPNSVANTQYFQPAMFQPVAFNPAQLYPYQYIYNPMGLTASFPSVSPGSSIPQSQASQQQPSQNVPVAPFMYQMPGFFPYGNHRSCFRLLCES